MALVAVIAFGGLGVWLQLDAARGQHPDDAIAGVRSVLRVLVLFALVTPFWSLFDQKASTWVLQADAMTKPSWFQSSQMQALNPLLVMLLIPFNNLVLYPALNRLGYEMTALRRMTAGIAFSGLSWIVVGIMQVVLDGGTPFTITWQVLPYALLTFGEVLVSATGLEFAYSQAPPAMKGVHHGVLEFVRDDRQSLGAGGECRRAKSWRDRLHQIERLRRDRVPDVLLRGVCVCRRRGLRACRAHLPGGGSLPESLARQGGVRAPRTKRKTAVVSEICRRTISYRHDPSGRAPHFGYFACAFVSSGPNAVAASLSQVANSIGSPR